MVIQGHVLCTPYFVRRETMILSTKACEYIDSLATGARMKIEKLANTTHLKYSDAVQYVKCFGGTVTHRPNQNSEIIKNSDETFTIFVKDENIEEVLHELGHAFLNWENLSGDQNGQLSYKNDGVANYDELAANYFMRSFVMPVETFMREVLKVTYNNICDFKALSETFNVSKHVVIARGNDLGLWA